MGTLRPGRAGSADGSCFADRPLRPHGANGADWSSRPGFTNGSLGTLGSGSTNRPCNALGTLRTGRTGSASRTCFTGRSLRTDWPGSALWPLGAGQAHFPSGTLRPYRPGHPLRSLRAGSSGVTNGTLGTHWPLWSGHTLWPLRTLRAGRTVNAGISILTAGFGGTVALAAVVIAFIEVAEVVHGTSLLALMCSPLYAPAVTDVTVPKSEIGRDFEPQAVLAISLKLCYNTLIEWRKMHENH